MNAANTSRYGRCDSARNARPGAEPRKPGATAGTPIATGSAGLSAASPGLAPRLSSTWVLTMMEWVPADVRPRGVARGAADSIVLPMLDLERHGDVFVL